LLKMPTESLELEVRELSNWKKVTGWLTSTLGAVAGAAAAERLLAFILSKTNSKITAAMAVTLLSAYLSKQTKTFKSAWLGASIVGGTQVLAQIVSKFNELTGSSIPTTTITTDKTAESASIPELPKGFGLGGRI